MTKITKSNTINTRLLIKSTNNSSLMKIIITTTITNSSSRIISMLMWLMSSNLHYRTRIIVELAGITPLEGSGAVVENMCLGVTVEIVGPTEGTTADNVAITTQEAVEVMTPTTSKIKAGVKIVTLRISNSSNTQDKHSSSSKRSKTISRLFKIPRSSALRGTVAVEAVVITNRETTLIVVITGVVVAKNKYKMVGNKLTASSIIINITVVTEGIVVIVVIVVIAVTEVTEVIVVINVVNEVSTSRIPTSKEDLAATARAKRRLALGPH